MQARCESLNVMEKTLGNVQPVETFCQPLLEAALKDAGYPLNVNTTWLRLYSPVADAFGVKTGGFKSKTFSLLQAALNNFDAEESEAGYYNAASGFITEPDARGHFERHATTLKIETFTQLCRGLDLGARYQAHLTSQLHPVDTVAEGVLRERYLRYQKDAFLAAAYLALVKGDVTDSDYALLLRVAEGEAAIMLGDKQVWYRAPCLMNLRLHDCLIIEPCVKYRYSDWFIAYIPDDPDHPIKRYANFSEFHNDLSARLKGAGKDRSANGSVTDTQMFFSRFIAYKDRPYYFRRLTELVVDAPPQPFATQWLGSEWGQVALGLAAPRLVPFSSLLGNPQPQVRVPVTDPQFHINADALGSPWAEIDLWPQRFEDLRKRMLADGRAQAISTADTDAAARAGRLQHYLNIGLFGVNLLAMAVPPLGVVMSQVMVGQLLYEVLEGAIELSEGDREAGWAHITDVLENVAQLAAGAAVFHFTVSPFIESLKSVQLPNGETRLWKPQLSGYEHTSPLPTARSTDELGLDRVGGRRLLSLEDKRYGVRQDPLTEKFYIEHPTRLNAYRPKLVENGSGAWNHELERPLEWQGVTLMRRLGPVVEGFSDEQLEHIRQVSGVEEATLRRMHVEGEPVPAMLLDTVRQFRAYDEAAQVAQGIGAGALSDALCSYAASLAVELPGWPSGKAIEAVSGAELSGPSVKYGDPQASGAQVLKVSRHDLMTGQLPQRIVDFLDEGQLDNLVGRQTPRTPQARVDAIRQQLQARAEFCRSRLMRSLYSSRQPIADTAVSLVQRDFKGLPTLMVRDLVAKARPAEKAQLDRGQRIPLRLAEQARRLQQQVRLNLAYEGLHMDAMANPDTEALALNSLANLPGWTDSLRLEVHDGGMEGTLRASFGPADAAERKVLVRVAEGHYQAFDARGQQLHGVNGLFGALQHALTDAHRNAIGLPHIGQGEQLRTRLIGKALSRDALRAVLGMQPERLPFFRWPWRVSDNRLGYPLSGRGRGTWRGQIEERVQALYRTMNPTQMAEYLRGRNLEDDRWLKALEAEQRQLDNVLSSWLVDGPRDRPTLRLRRKLYDVIKNAWAKSGEWDVDLSGNYRGQRIYLENPGMGAQIATLPALPGNFDHVTSLHLPGCGLTDQGAGFLSTFRRLRILNLDDNQLTQLPDACAQMSRLEGLDLSDNEVVLTEQAALQLRGLHRMEWLALQGNPLLLPVDISRMPRLRWLYLSGCGLSAWPVGVFASPRPREFLLELTGNHLTSIPDVAPGSERARILARTAVTREWLRPDVLAKLKVYLESVGLDPNRRFPPRGAQDSAHWMRGMTKEQWLDKQGVWNDLEEALDSEPFFDEIRKLSEHLEARPEAYKVDLTAKVWRMLEAMAGNEGLRERLFQMAVAPTTCVDAGAQLFNGMGVEVLLHEALSLANADLKRLELLALAKGKARLDELGRIAHARVSELVDQGRRFPEYDSDGGLVQQTDAAGNPVLGIDEVEIHMAYVTRLADRLELPWQTAMFYREPDVTDAMIEAAHSRVVALEHGDLLRDGIIDQPFWADYVQDTFANEFEAVSAKNEALIDLYEAQHELADNGDLSAQKKADLRQVIDTSTQVLGKSPSQVSPERVMSDDEFFADMADLGEERKNVLRTVTDRVMGREPQNRK
ncbi:DUF6543 domain-containing protein [Pseudomonas sp. KBW05]|uniref:dermonecrotic toxin domain-containing protein n=1 Tax=Pseudomonas sp. KBW05 TaxID=2153360 RepID=UPI000F5A71E7|nr:DUF6543 domain-containing protein [Pseudomonas sp. KBW05]RQO59108.1 hypothetical protein DBR46_07240 [Pseudomonas sp. KBW05]